MRDLTVAGKKRQVCQFAVYYLFIRFQTTDHHKFEQHVNLKAPGGAYLVLDIQGGLLERGLIREGGYSQNQMTRIQMTVI